MEKQLLETKNTISKEELIVLNQSAMKLAKVSEYDELFKIIVETLKDLTKVKSVVVGMYDKQKKVSKAKYFEIDSFILKELMTLFGGKKITEIEFPISDKAFEIIRKSPVSMLPTLNEAAFGSISGITGRVVQKIQGIDRYVGLAYFIDDELFGTTLIGLEKSSADPSTDLLYSFTQFVSLTLKRLKVATELKNSEEKYRAFAENTNDVFWYMDENYHFTYMSKGGEKMLGYSRDEMLNKKATDLLTPEGIEIIKKANDERLKKEQQGEKTGTNIHELQYLKKDGSLLWVEISVSVHRDSNGRLTGYHGVTRDIDHRKTYENELVKREEKYRLIAENMGNVITMLDMELNYIYGTPNIESVLGYKLDEYLNLKLEQTMTPESLQIVMKTFEDEMAAEISGTADPKRTKVLELEEFRKDGSTIWMENVISFVRDEAGKPAGILSVSRDVTERKLAAEEKARLTQQLYHAQKMESVGTLAGGIAHDFNNLLQVIGGYTSMLLSVEERDPAETDKLKTIEKAVDRASELISNLLAFSRKNISMRKVIDLNIEIQLSVRMLKRTIPKMVNINTVLDPSIFKISADPVQIEQIILNLGKNASDAMPDGGEMLIKTENIETSAGTDCYCGKIPEGRYVLITFSDTGHGMEKEIIDHIFDPFFTTKTVGRGTGLGLSSVYGIVKNHGGYINCKSEPGNGTVFSICLPAADPVNDRERVISEKTGGKLEGKETILVADDEKSILEMYSSALKEFGYTVITTQNGEDALNILSRKEKTIDLVILDLGMPGMGGFKCMLEIKKMNPDIKIIVASGYSDVFKTADLIRSGASGFIQKPFKLKNILEKIRITLNENTPLEKN